MASNQTAALGLSQWAAADAVLREDFNADNAKIEAALMPLALRKLATITLSATVNAVEIDLSGVDLDLYSELQMRIYTYASHEQSSSAWLYALLNNVSSTGAYSNQDLTSTSSGVGASPAEKLRLGDDVRGGSEIALSLRILPSASSVFVISEGGCAESVVSMVGRTVLSTNITRANLESITLYLGSLGSTSYKLAAGGKIYLYGVMK